MSNRPRRSTSNATFTKFYNPSPIEGVDFFPSQTQVAQSDESTPEALSDVEEEDIEQEDVEEEDPDEIMEEGASEDDLDLESAGNANMDAMWDDDQQGDSDEGLPVHPPVSPLHPPLSPLYALLSPLHLLSSPLHPPFSPFVPPLSTQPQLIEQVTDHPMPAHPQEIEQVTDQPMLANVHDQPAQQEPVQVQPAHPEPEMRQQMPPLEPAHWSLARSPIRLPIRRTAVPNNEATAAHREAFTTALDALGHADATFNRAELRNELVERNYKFHVFRVAPAGQSVTIQLFGPGNSIVNFVELGQDPPTMTCTCQTLQEERLVICTHMTFVFLRICQFQLHEVPFFGIAPTDDIPLYHARVAQIIERAIDRLVEMQ